MLTPTTSVLGMEPLNHQNSQDLISFVTASTYRALPEAF